MRRVVILLLIILLWLPGAAQTARSDPSQTLALTNVAVIDMTGAPVKSGLTVIISDGRIAAIGRSSKTRLPKNAKVIDATGKFLIPGLWDMHVHLGDEDFDRNVHLSLFVANGVTGIRLMDGDPVYYKWRKETESGKLLAPRMIIAGQVIGSGSLSNISETAARAEVRRARREGADFIKVHDDLSRESYFAVIDEARRSGLPVVGHVPSSVTAAEAAQAGQKSIEHFTGLDEAKTDDRKARALIPVLKKNRTWICPTLVMRHNYALLNDASFADDPRLKYIKPSWKAGWLRSTQEAQKWSPQETANRKETIQTEDALVGKLRKAGVGILAGTDVPNPYVLPGFSLHDELILLVNAGSAPMQALQAATYDPAKFLGLLRSHGTIEKGKTADLVLLDANPLENIANTKRVDSVIINGRYLPRASLDELLDAAARSTPK